MKPLCSDHRETAVRISKNKYRIGSQLVHRLVAFRYDIPHSFSQIGSYCIQIKIRILQSQVLKEYPIQIVIVILPRMNQNGIKVSSAFLYHGCQSYDLRTGTYDYHQLDPAVFHPFWIIHVLSLPVLPIQSYIELSSCQRNPSLQS